MRAIVAITLLVLSGCSESSKLEGQYEAASKDPGSYAKRCKIARRLVEHYSDVNASDEMNEWSAKSRGDCAMWEIVRDASQRGER